MEFDWNLMLSRSFQLLKASNSKLRPSLCHAWQRLSPISYQAARDRALTLALRRANLHVFIDFWRVFICFHQFFHQFWLIPVAFSAAKRLFSSICVLGTMLAWKTSLSSSLAFSRLGVHQPPRIERRGHRDSKMILKHLKTSLKSHKSS